MLSNFYILNIKGANKMNEEILCLRDFKILYIQYVLEKCNYDIKKTAEILNISDTMVRKYKYSFHGEIEFIGGRIKEIKYKTENNILGINKDGKSFEFNLLKQNKIQNG